MISAIVFLFVIRLSSFQTYLAKIATSYFSNELKTTISVGKLDIVFFNRIYLDNILVLDLRKDSLLAVKSIEVTLENLNLFGKKIKIKDVELVNGFVNISKSSKSNKYNFQFFPSFL